MRTIITIGRESGSGGHEIGKRLAQELNIPFYDREILEKASKESGICKELFEENDEKNKASTSFLYSIVMGVHSGYSTTSLMSDMPLNQKLFLSQFDAIKSAAAEGPCVIVGRCGDYALELDPNRLSVFLFANLEYRIRRISKIFNITNSKARERIQKIDKSRSNYYNYYSNKRWGDVDSYDLAINTGLFGVDGTIDLIKKAIEIKETDNKQNLYDDPEV